MDSSWNLDKSPYDILGVYEDATEADVKSAYRDLARLFHPDRNHGKDQTKERENHFVAIKKAYETLSDPEARSMYDMCSYQKEQLVRRNVYRNALAYQV